MQRETTRLAEGADSLFAGGESERAAFEAGIKLGALFHQFTGTPISAGTAGSLERAMTESLQNQPYVVEAEASIDREMLDRALKGKGYTSLTGEMLIARVVVEFKGKRVTARLAYKEELDYPLMYIESVE